MPHANECRHIKTGGGKCRAAALRGTPFCYFHTRLHHSAKQPPTPAPAIDIPVAFEDRCDLQLAICQVLRALVSKSIDKGTASTLLYGLQLASQNIDKSYWAIPITVVDHITRTSDGDVLAVPKQEEEDYDEEEDGEEEYDEDGVEEEGEEEEDEEDYDQEEGDEEQGDQEDDGQEGEAQQDEEQGQDEQSPEAQADEEQPREEEREDEEQEGKEEEQEEQEEEEQEEDVDIASLRQIAEENNILMQQIRRLLSA